MLHGGRLRVKKRSGRPGGDTGGHAARSLPVLSTFSSHRGGEEGGVLCSTLPDFSPSWLRGRGWIEAGRRKASLSLALSVRLSVSRRHYPPAHLVLIYMSKLPARYSSKQEIKNRVGRSSDLFPIPRGLPFSPSCEKVTHAERNRISKELTAEDAAPDSHRVPFSIRQSRLLSVESPTRGQM